MKDVDLDDIAFVALSSQLNSKLWTGDKKLIQGLNSNNFSKVITTGELIEYRNYKEKL